MKKVAFILFVLVFMSLSFTSCQKAEEPKKEVKTEVRSEPPVTPEARKKEVVNDVLVKEVKKDEATAEAVKEKPLKVKPGTLTEEELRFFNEIGYSVYVTPDALESREEAIRFLKISLKGDHRIMKVGGAEFYNKQLSEEQRIEMHGGIICSAMQALASKYSKYKEVFDLILEVMEKKRDYPDAYACASDMIGWYAMREGRNERAMLPLKEAIKHKNSKVRLEAAGALLATGETDIALPVLDELAKQGMVRALKLLYEPEDKKKGEIRWTKLWDERGLDIIKRALDYPSDEVKGWAAIACTRFKVETEKAEEVSFNIVKKLMYKTIRDYGLGKKPGSGVGLVLLPGYEGKNIQELEDLRTRDLYCSPFVKQRLTV